MAKKKQEKITEESSAAPMDVRARARELARKTIADKFADSGAEVITADKLDDGLRFLTIPDILVQAQLSRPGFAMGRIDTIIGFEGCSKSSNLYWKCGLAIEAGGLADIVSLEKAESTEHMRHYIKDPSQVTIWRASSLEEAIKMSLEIQRIYKEVDPEGLLAKVQGFDSVAAGTLEALLEEEKEAGAKTPGGIGKIMADFVNIMKDRIIETQTLWVVINQARDKQAMGKMEAMALQWAPQVEKLVAKGGRALPFQSTYFEVLERTGRVKDEDKIIQGFGVRATFKKNKLGKPEGQFSYDIAWGKGFDFSENTVEVLAASSVLGMTVKAKRYTCPEIGVTEKLDYIGMYEVIHHPDHLEKFRNALGVISGVELKAQNAPPPFVPTPAPIEIQTPKPAPAPAVIPPTPAMVQTVSVFVAPPPSPMIEGEGMDVK